MKYSVEHGSYYLKDGENILFCGQEIALAVSVDSEDPSMVTRHKHGDPKLVQKWAATHILALRQGGLDEMADEMKVITGQFPVDEINEMLECSGRTRKFYESAMDGTMQREQGVAPIEPEDNSMSY
jgi:hypothetical protein